MRVGVECVEVCSEGGCVWIVTLLSRRNRRVSRLVVACTHYYHRPRRCANAIIAFILQAALVLVPARDV